MSLGPLGQERRSRALNNLDVLGIPLAFALASSGPTPFAKLGQIHSKQVGLRGEAATY